MNNTYNGRFWKDGDTIRWRLTDAFGWLLSGTAEKDPAGGYILTGALGATPESLRLPGEDEMRHIVTAGE